MRSTLLTALLLAGSSSLVVAQVADSVELDSILPTVSAISTASLEPSSTTTEDAPTATELPIAESAATDDDNEVPTSTSSSSLSSDSSPSATLSTDAALPTISNVAIADDAGTDGDDEGDDGDDDDDLDLEDGVITEPDTSDYQNSDDDDDVVSDGTPTIADDSDYQNTDSEPEEPTPTIADDSDYQQDTDVEEEGTSTEPTDDDGVSSSAPDASSTATDEPTSSPTATTDSATSTTETETATSISSAAPTPTKYSSASWTFTGCFADSVSARTLPNLLNVGGKWDQATCLAAAEAGGYSQAGLEYGGECWGSNAAPSSTYALEASACDFTCNDGPGESCGGNNTLDVYAFQKLASVEWSYSGCYADGVNGVRTMPNRVSRQAAWTQPACLSAVADAGYKYGGIEYHGECWGSNDFPDASLAIDASQCQYECNDAPGTTCGGSNALDVYSSTGVAYPTTTSSALPSATAVVVPGKAVTSDFVYVGCYTDSVSARTLPHGISAASWTATSCLAAVEAAGYTYGGIIYGGECWGANEIASTAEVQDADQCTWTCNDDKSQQCGGQSGLDVYVKVDTSLEGHRMHKMRRSHRA